MVEKILGNESLTEKMVKKGFWLYFFVVITAPLGYLIRMILSKSLPVADIGIIYSVMWLIWLVSVYNDVGMTESLLYFLPKYRVKKQYDYFKSAICLSVLFQLITWFILFLIIRFGAAWLAENHFQSPDALWIVRYFWMYMLWINFFQVLTSIFGALQDIFQQKLLNFIKMVWVLGVTIWLFFWNHASIEWYSLSRIIWLWLSVFVWWFFLFKKYNFVLAKGKFVVHKAMIKEYRKYALRSFISMNAWSLIRQIDQQMVINLMGPESAGIYSNYISLIKINSLFVSPILGFIFPLISELVAKKNFDKIQLLTNYIYTIFITFSIFLGSFLFIIGPDFASILFGKGFVESGNLLRISAPFLWVLTVNNINFAYLSGLNKVKKKVLILSIATIINIVLNIILIPSIGLLWAVIASITSRLVITVINIIVIMKSIHIKIHWAFVIKNVLIAWANTSLILSFIYPYMDFSDQLLEIQNVINYLLLLMVFTVPIILINNNEVRNIYKQTRNIIWK